MTEQNWKPLFRTPKSTVTKVLRSPAFLSSRERAGALLDDPAALRTLADAVEKLDHVNAPLSAIADQVAAAVRFLRAQAQESRLETEVEAAGSPEASVIEVEPDAPMPHRAGTAARERLLVAAMDYLITPVDLVPDFKSGGYIDDVLLLSWVFGAAFNELAPFLDDDAPV